MIMTKPKALSQGSTLGIVGPSSPSTEEKVLSAKKQLESMGFNVKLTPTCHAIHGYLAGNDKLRADDLNSLFIDKDVDGIICLRGGYGAMKILDKVDFDSIRNNPKIFVGYSDITALHTAINQKSNLVTFHGPMFAADISDLDTFSKNEFIRAMTVPQPMGDIPNPDGEDVETLVSGIASGPLVGGNLALVSATMGTPYELDTKGKILFLEEIGEEPYKVDRMLTQLALGGKFDEAAGIVLGDWNNCESQTHENTLTLMEVFQEIIVPINKPTIYNLQAGHCSPKVTIPLGVESTLNANNGVLTIEEVAIKNG